VIASSAVVRATIPIANSVARQAKPLTQEILAESSTLSADLRSVDRSMGAHGSIGILVSTSEETHTFEVPGSNRHLQVGAEK
jgi:hypothetical protein